MDSKNEDATTTIVFPSEVDDGVTLKPATSLDSIENTKPGSYVWLVALSAAIGGLLFGYDTGVISGVLVVLGDALDGRPLGDSEKELITSITSGGAFVGAIAAGFTADKHGRRPVIWVGAAFFTIGALIQALSWSLVQMTVGRFIIGLGVGSAAMVVPLYIAELAPAKHRGRMVVVDCMCITGGQVLAYAVAAAFEHVAHGWRYMVGLGGVPSVLLAVLLFWCPESPRQLIYKGRSEECARVLRKIYPHASESQISDKVLLLQKATQEDKALGHEMTIGRSLWELYTIPANLRALVAACGLMGIQQICGFNTLMYYSATLFSIVGFKNAIGVGSVVAVTNFLFTAISLKYVDRIGRRRILVSTMWGMAAALVVAAVAFHFIPIDRATLQLETDSAGAPGIVALVAIIFFVAFFATGLGNVPWTANELLPSNVRAMGTMMITATNWGLNIVISSTFLSMMKGITPSGTFGFYAAICFLGWIFVICCYPEAANMTLEQVKFLFDDGFGVRKAAKWQKEHKQAVKENMARQRSSV